MRLAHMTNCNASRGVLRVCFRRFVLCAEVFILCVVSFGCATLEVPVEKSVYEFKVKSAGGEDVSLNLYKGKVLLIVNTASKCGFTPQYAGLRKLYEKYKKSGFVVLAFPCNQFGSQEPGDDASIQKFCELNYGVSFPVFAKIAVNGENADPLFKYLKHAKSGFLTESVKWNFTKFLVNREGVPVARYSPMTSPAQLDDAIQEQLAITD